MNAQPTQHDPVAMKHSLRGRPRELLIGGQWRPAVDGKTLDVLAYTETKTVSITL